MYDKEIFSTYECAGNFFVTRIVIKKLWMLPLSTMIAEFLSREMSTERIYLFCIFYHPFNSPVHDRPPIKSLFPASISRRSIRTLNLIRLLRARAIESRSDDNWYYSKNSNPEFRNGARELIDLRDES